MERRGLVGLAILSLIIAQCFDCVLCGEKLALLSATLRTYQKAACDTDQVIIACPRGTSISIEFAQYNKFIAKDGYSIEDLCPASGVLRSDIRGKAKHLLRGSIFGSSTQQVPANRYVNGGYALPPPPQVEPTSNSSSAATGTEQAADGDNSPENCMWPNALQYTLLQTVVEACQKKKHCKFHGSPQFHGLGASGVGDASGTSSYHSSTASSTAISSDPCPKRRKIVEVAYKCRPYEFRSKVACHNDVAQLECNPYSRIAVYSASFGRTEYESIQCPQPQGVREETCLASFATETVMQICHGRRRCNLAADANTFGTPCQPNSRMYLKVVYTCVPKQVLKEGNDLELEADETEDFESDINDLDVDELIYKESEAIPKLYSNLTKTHGNATKNAGAATGARGGGAAANSSPAGMQSVTNNSLDNESDGSGVNPVMTHSADLSLEVDQERLYWYLLIIGMVGVLISIVIVATRLVLQRQRLASDTHSNSSTKGGAGGSAGMADETTIPSGFNDTISEIDADIDLTTAIPLPSVSKNEVGIAAPLLPLDVANYSMPLQNYITYAPAGSLYASLAPSQLGSVGGAGATAGLIPNPLLVNARQSPDLIGISNNTYIATSGSSGSAVSTASMTGILAPAIVIGANGSGGALPSGSSGINTMVPISSLTQYTTAPTIRGGYIISPESISVLQRPTNTPTPPASVASGSPAHPPSATSPLAMAPLSHLGTPGTSSTLRRSKPNPAAMLHQQLSYDGTAPRTLSTGLSVGSQFYYG
ncbi:uncharacterized protein LOC108604566 isoform X2 [Drosophila busckii]|uniref:uncharacterized protein LOC108604566 isoform X2 n=1 Tax=Drosophila busckii TaxID=30019 RepID=UPI00083EAC15|nr:uncharacterized protein LOC108604566 isoform X2 [Drosophila busckii]